MSSFLERRVFYVPGENSAIDEVMPDGKGRWGGRTLEETRIEHPDAVEISLREALTRIDEANRKKYNVGKPVEITREKWWYFLEVLPRTIGGRSRGDAERFMMIEYLSNNINGISPRGMSESASGTFV